jgi:competence protein ComEC
MRLTFGGRSILFTGDIQAKGEAALMNDAGVSLGADVLVAPHHGSAEETTPRFLEAVGAPVVLASDDRTPSGKQRAFDRIVGERRLYRTNRCGAITVRVTREGDVRVETFRK